MRLIFFILLCTCLSCSNTPQPKSDTITIPVATPITSIANGEKLFKINCVQCHRPAEDFAAPAIAGSENRWKDKTLLYEFVRNSQDVIKRDKYAASLFEKWNKVYMQPFSHLTNEDIDAILKYCNQVAKQ
ncbi:MAG: cytochrome c [Ferruginibacter sp.]